MKRKINLLISLSAVVLLLLCCMQFYLVTTTYNYKVAQFRSEVKDRLSKITNDYSDIDSTIFHKKDFLYKDQKMRERLDREWKKANRPKGDEHS